MRFDIRSIDKRKLARIVAVVAVALAAGHLVQTMAARKAAPARATAVVADTQKPVDVVQLAGTIEDVAEPATPPAPLPPVALSVVPTVVPAPMPTPAPVPAPKVAAVPEAAAAPKVEAAPVVVADPCPVKLDLMVDPGAMLGLTLIAPCHARERVVLHHAGLAVTATTTANGSLSVSLPALETAASVQVKFADGSTAFAAEVVPDLADMRRFGVQWQGDDAFQVYGYEDEATISATNPGLAPIGTVTPAGGFLTRLGDAGAANPLLAEIYTFPATAASDVVIESAVTPATCGREILGETLSSTGGTAVITDLTLAMPECDAVGDFLVLKNLVPDLTLAAAN